MMTLDGRIQTAENIDAASPDWPPSPARPSRLKFWFRAAVSLGLIVYLARQIDFGQLSTAIRTLHWDLWGTALALYIGTQVLSARRWSALARTVDFQASELYFLRRYFEGMFFSLCLPTSFGGDVIKAWRLGHNAAKRFLAGCTVLTDRMSGLAALFIIGTAALAYRLLDLSPLQLAFTFGLLIALLFGLMWLGTTLLRRGSDRLERLPKVGKTIASLRPYLDKPYVLFRAVGYSLVIQTMNVLVVWCLGLAMGLEVPPEAFFVAVPGAALASALPISISGIGIREGSLAFFLTQYGLPQPVGITLGLLWFLIVTLSGLVGGLVYLADRQAEAVSEPEGESTLLPLSLSHTSSPNQPQWKKVA